jgi:hypothetical protein
VGWQTKVTLLLLPLLLLLLLLLDVRPGGQRMGGQRMGGQGGGGGGGLYDGDSNVLALDDSSFPSSSNGWVWLVSQLEVTLGE